MTLIPLILYFSLYPSIHSIAKYLVLQSSPLFAMVTRMTLGGLLMLIFLLFKNGKKTFFIVKKHPYHVAIGAFFRCAFPTSAIFWAYQYLPLGRFALFVALAPFSGAFLSYVMLNERLTKRKWLGIIIAFLSLIPLTITMPETTASVFERGSLFILPELAVIAYLLSLQYGWLKMKHLLVVEPSISLFTLMAYDMFFGGLLVSLLFLVGLQTVPAIKNPFFFSQLLFLLIVVAGFIARPVYAWLVKSYNFVLLAIAELSKPFFTSIFGWIVFKETVGSTFFIAMFFVASGFFLFYWDDMKKSRLGSESSN